jgi:hypothetical protein
MARVERAVRVARAAMAARARGPGQGRTRDKGTIKDRAVDSDQEGGKGQRNISHPPHGRNRKGQAGVILSSRHGRGQAIVVFGVTGTLDGDACIAGPTTVTAAWMGSQALFILAEDPPPAKVPVNAPINQANLGTFHWIHFVLSPLFDLQ